jgi:GNAT superfamily N-acetyltransferase
VIRAARPDDFDRLREIERAAGASFRELDMDLVADDAPPSIQDLLEYQLDGRAWVWCGDADNPVAYLLVEVVDRWLNIAQVSVHPSRAREGLGRQLLDFADQRAAANGLIGLSLTTFVHVPWNRPYYQRLGFRTVDDDFIPGLREGRALEARNGLDAWPRVVMVREVGR